MAVYITQSLYLTSGFSGLSANAPRIGYINHLSSGAVTADFEEAAYPASNINNLSTASFWRSSDDSATQYLNFQITPQKTNYLGLAAHNLQGAELKLQRRDDPADPWIDVTTPVIPQDNHAIMWLFDDVLTSPYWRLEIEPAASTAPRVGIAFLGEFLTLQRNRYVGVEPSKYAVNSTFSTNSTEGGQFLGRKILRQVLDMNLTQDNVDRLFYTSYIDPFANYARTGPFFLAHRPSSFPNEIAFGWDEQRAGIRMLQDKPNGYVSFKISGRALAPLRS